MVCAPFHTHQNLPFNYWLEPVLELGALYDPNLLPDYLGDLFEHKFAKLVQQDIIDTEDNLVAPWLMHDKLRPGTVIVVDTTLVCWHIGGKEGQRSRNVCIIVHKTYGSELAC